MKKEKTNNKILWFIKYISTVISWTVFALLIIVGTLLLYYYISLRLYATKGDDYEPKFSLYTIVSQSMEPTINVYDVIVNSKVDESSDIETNDVITFTSTWKYTSGMIITHRVIGIRQLDDGGVCYITRGDNNTQPDQECVKLDRVIGVTKAVIPGLGKVQFFLASKAGWLICILIPALFIIVKDVMKVIFMSKNKTKVVEPKNKKLALVYKDLQKIKSRKK